MDMEFVGHHAIQKSYYCCADNLKEMSLKFTPQRYKGNGSATIRRFHGIRLDRNGIYTGPR